MHDPEETDWIARIGRELEPLRRVLQLLARDIEQASRTFAEVREKWQPLFEACRQLSRAFVAARGSFQARLRLTGWMLQQIEAAKDNPTHRTARAWLIVQHLTPKEVAELLPYMIMDMPDLRVPKRKGRPRRIAASTLEMAEQLDKRIKHTGELPTPAARRLLKGLGFKGDDIKGRADHLVKVWRNSVLKSR